MSKSQRKRREKKKKKKACGFSSVFAKMKTRHFAASGCKAPEMFFFFSDAMPLQKLQAAVFFKLNEGFDVICWSLRCSARASSNHLCCNVPVTWPKKCLFVLFVFEKEEMDQSLQVVRDAYRVMVICVGTQGNRMSEPCSHTFPQGSEHPTDSEELLNAQENRAINTKELWCAASKRRI